MKCPLDIQKCLFVHRTNRNVQWILKCPMDRWTFSDGKHSSLLSTWGYAQSYYVIIALLSDTVKVTCPLDIMKCSLDIQMSIRPLDEQKCPVDIEMSIRPMDQWTLSDGKHSCLQSTWGYIQSYYVIIALLSDAVKVTRSLDIMKCPLDIQKCPLDIQMSIGHSNVHSTNRNVQWTFKCPSDILQRYWTLIN